MLPLIGERSTASLSGPYAQPPKIGPDNWCMLHVLMSSCPILDIRAILAVVHGFRCTAECNFLHYHINLDKCHLPASLSVHCPNDKQISNNENKLT